MGNSSIFSLGQIYQKQIRDKNYVNIFDPFIFVTTAGEAGGPQAVGPAMGYWAGGGYGSVVDRVDFSNDTPTASPRGNLSVERTSLKNGGSTPSYGYAVGGTPGPKTSVDRIDYSNDTGTASPKGRTTSPRAHAATVTNTNYGYTGGGDPSQHSLVDRIDYANDTATATSLGNIMSPGAREYTSTGNQSYGYYLGGYDPSYGYRSTVRRIDYSNDTATTSPRGSLRDICGHNAATGNANYGWIKGGANATRGPIEVLDFANDTATPATTTSNILTVPSSNRGATGSADFGYFGGGSGPDRSYVDRIDYSNYTAAAVTKGPLTVARDSMATFSAREHGLPFSPFSPPTAPGPNASRSDRGIGPAHGYWAGGKKYGGDLSLVQRIDFENDTATASNKGNLPIAVRENTGSSNDTHGYSFGGYYNYGAISNTYRVDYADDTVAASPKGQLSQNTRQAACVGTKDTGYLGGISPGYFSRIVRYSYSSDTSTSIADDIFDPGSYGTAATGNNTHGYFVGGNNITGNPGNPYYSVVRRLDYSNDTATTSPKGNLTAGSVDNGATGNNNFGYFSIQDYYTYAPLGQTSIITRIQYANDTATSSPRGNLNWVSQQNRATGSKDYGYFGGGYHQSYSIPDYYNSAIDRIDYASDTATASPKGPLNTGVGYGNACFGGQQNQFNEVGNVVDHGSDGLYATSPLGPASGYWGGGAVYQGSGPGNYYPRISTMSRLDYANDTAGASSKGPLPQEADEVRAVASKTHGYWTLGQMSSYIQRVDFANDSPTTTNRGTITPRANLYAVGNESYGYMAGGRWSSDPSNYRQDRTERIDYANDNVAAATKGPLSSRSEEGGATGNANYGYFGGGYIYPAPNPASSKVDRLDYANDTTAATPKGSLSVGRFFVSATGNRNYGWFGGGFDQFPAPGNPNSVIDRIDYANDTAIASLRGSLNYDRARAGATGSANYGYWAGGNDGSNSYTNIERVDYANDTGTPSIRSNLPYTPGPAYGKKSNSGAASGQANGLISETSIYTPRVRFIDGLVVGAVEPASRGGTIGPQAGPSNGYVMGGYPGGSLVDRINFANDTATASTKGNLSFPSYRGGGTGNKSFGYTFGGNSSSKVSRLDYANDTNAGSQRGNLYTPADYCASVGNNNFGYTGGRPWSYTSTLGKVDYSNDTVRETLLGNNLFPGSPSPGYYGYGGVGNQNFGYYVGGYPASSSVRSIDYSNDAVAVAPKGPLTSSAPYSCATGNANFGWVSVGSYSAINRIDYANDTATASPKGDLSVSSAFRSTTGDNNYGYWCGGTYPTTSRVSRVDFANDTAGGVTKGPLSANRYYLCQGYSAKQNGNPQTPVPPTGIVQAPFPPPFLFPREGSRYSPATSYPYGYVTGGYAFPGVGYITTIQRFDYNNDTAIAVEKGGLYPFNYAAAVGSKTHGYIGQASTGVHRIDYANDTAAGVPVGGGLLGDYAQKMGATGNIYYGWFGGGYPSNAGVAPESTVSRLDYANDNGTGLTRGPLSLARYNLTGVGNQSYGYFGGGSMGPTGGDSEYAPPIVSALDRIQYANDTAIALTKGPLSAPIMNVGAAGNADYGYWAGGFLESSAGTTIRRLDYANDTNVTLPKGALSEEKYTLSGTGNLAYGYLCAGGFQLPNSTDITGGSSKIERIDYANDTATASPKGPLIHSSRRNQAVSSEDNANT